MIGKLDEVRSISYKPIQSFIFIIVIFLSVFLLATQYYLYALLPALIILFLFLLGRNPQIGYYLVIFFIPFTAFRGLSETYGYLTISKFVGFWIVIVILFYFFLKKIGSFDIKSNLWPLLFLFFGISLISSFISDYRLTSIDNIRQLVTSYIIFALTIIFLNQKSFTKTLPFIIIISISISSLLAVIGYLFNIPFFAIHVGTESLKRGTGAAGDPNVLSAMVVFSLPILSYWFFITRKVLEKTFIAVLFLINSIAMLSTYSRSGAIAFTAVLFLLVIVHRKRFKPKYFGFLALITLIIIVAAVMFIPISYWERQKSVTEAADTAINRRISYLYAGWDAFKENPIIGSGPGTFTDTYAMSVYSLQYPKDESGERRYPAHNSYVEVLVGTGTIGFIVFGLIILLVLRNFHISKKRFQLNGEEGIMLLID